MNEDHDEADPWAGGVSCKGNSNRTILINILAIVLKTNQLILRRPLIPPL